MTKNKGITLIALIITIIILLLLAGISIVAITGENGLISRAKLAKTEQEKAQAKEELQLKITELQLKIAGEEGREATLEDFNNLISEDEELTFISASYTTASTEIVQGEFNTIKVLYKEYIFTVDAQLVIIEVEENTNMANVDLSYEIKNITEIDGKTMYKVLIKLQSDEKITRVEYGEQVLKSDIGTEEIGIDFEVENNTKYTFKITTLNGKIVEKYININGEIIFANGNPKTEDYFSSFTNTNSSVMIYDNKYYFMYASYDGNWCLLHSTNPIDFSNIKQIVVDYILLNDGNGILATLTSGIQKEYNDDVNFDISTSNSTRSNSDVSMTNILDVSNYNENGYLKIKLSHDGGDWAHTAYAYITSIGFIYNN